MPAGDGYGGRPAQRFVAGVLAMYGTTCHLCGHGQADSADHLTTRAELVQRGELHRMYDLTNGRPVHHKPCPVCGLRCNIKRKAKPITKAQPIDGRGFFDRRPHP